MNIVPLGMAGLPYPAPAAEPRGKEQLARRIIKLCGEVEVLANALEKLDVRRQVESTQAVLLRMQLAAVTSELVAADLIERVRRNAAPAAAR